MFKEHTVNGVILLLQAVEFTVKRKLAPQQRPSFIF